MYEPKMGLNPPINNDSIKENKICNKIITKKSLG